MAFTYSVRFGAGTIAAGTAASIYTVPVGNIAVVRCIAAIPLGTGAANMLAAIVGFANFMGEPTTTVNDGFVWQGRVVLNAGESLQVQAIGQSFQYAVSGYLLAT